MGEIFSSLKKGKEDEAKQELDILQKLVDSKLDKFEADLDAKFLNPEATQKTEIPGIRALRKTRFSTAQIVDKPADEVGKAIDNFFSIGNPGVKTGDALKAGFKNVVSTASNVFLGNTEIGQHEETQYFIYMHHNAVVRLDVKLWRWNFVGHGLSDTYKSVLGYIVCLSIVDASALKTVEFVYLLSEYGGDDEEQVTKYVEGMSKIYARVRKLMKDQDREID